MTVDESLAHKKMQMNDHSKQAVVDSLNDFSRRTKEIIDRIGDRQSVSTIEKNAIKVLYKALKADLKDAAELAAVNEGRLAWNKWEGAYYCPAVMKAANALRAKSNTHPIASNWKRSLMDAEHEISYYLYHLQKDHQTNS